MKKIVYILLLGALFLSYNSKKVLYVYTWSDYIPQKIYDQFTEETGIVVIENMYFSNEEMYKNLKTGKINYDLIVPSQDYLLTLINEKSLEKIDREKISTFKNISPMIVGKLDNYLHSDETYAVPYAIGVSGFLVNKKYVTEEVVDFSIFQNKKYQGRMTLLNEMREVMVPALVTLGYDQNTTNSVELKKAKELIESWSNNVDKFTSKDVGFSFNIGEYYVVHTYIDSVSNTVTLENNNLKIVIPEKGAVSCIDSFAIPKGSRNKKNALKFIEFIHRPDIYAQIVDVIQIPSINTAAQGLITKKPLYEIEDIRNTTLVKNLPEGDFKVQNKYWEELKKAKKND